MTPAELRTIRRGLGLSQAAMACELGLGSNGGRTVRRYESGEIEPSGPVLRLYAEFRSGSLKRSLDTRAESVESWRMADEPETPPEEAGDELRVSLEAAFDEAEAADETPPEETPPAEAAPEPKGDDVPRETPPAEAAPEETPEADPEPAAAVEPPEHWPHDEQEMFRKQTPEAQAWLRTRDSQLDASYNKSLEKLSPAAQVINQWAGYAQSIGQTVPQMVDYVGQADQQLRHGTEPQKTAMLYKIAHDFRVQGVQFGAPAEGAVELDPQVAQLTQTVNRMEAGQAQAAQQEHQRSEAQMQSVVKTFAEAKTDAGTLAHPYFLRGGGRHGQTGACRSSGWRQT